MPARLKQTPIKRRRLSGSLRMMSMPSGDKTSNGHQCGNDVQCITGKMLFACWFSHLAGLQVTVTRHLSSILKTNTGSHELRCS